MRSLEPCDTMSNDLISFAENQCKCDKGVSQIGAGCPINGAAKCASCNTGWTLNQDKTKCIGKCTV